MTPGNPPSGTPMTPAELNRHLDRIEAAIRRLQSKLADSHDRMGLRQLAAVLNDNSYSVAKMLDQSCVDALFGMNAPKLPKETPK